jgi:4-hydroxybenzoate polyprenyltransferase
MPKTIINYIAIAVAFSILILMYWIAADPPNPWILVFIGAAVLFIIGISLYKKRTGRLQ